MPKQSLQISCKFFLGLFVGALVGFPTLIHAQNLGVPLPEIVGGELRDCPPAGTIDMPVLAQGADAVTIHANGTQLPPGGAMAAAGIALNLTVVASFKTQLETYQSCGSPFLRGSLGMLTAAAPLTEADPRTEQIVFYKHGWSTRDAIVTSEGIAKVTDLHGKRVALQAYGPHIELLGKVLSDAGMRFSDIEVVWTQDLSGDGLSTPAALIRDGSADAAAMSLSDAQALTTDREVTGTSILISTQVAAAVIGEYISVRKDFFDANRDLIARLTNQLFRSEETVRTAMAQEEGAEKQALSAFLANIIPGGLPPEAGMSLWRDTRRDGWSGNARHFSDPKAPRRFEVMSAEVSTALQDAGMIDQPYQLGVAAWDFGTLANGLADPDGQRFVGFDPHAVVTAVQRLRHDELVDAHTMIARDVYFAPNIRGFSTQDYAKDFQEIARLAATYSGAVLLVEGHSDPLHFLRQEKNGAAPKELRAIWAAARNLSLERAGSALDALMTFGEEKGLRINPDQFTLDGVGIDDPAFPAPQTRKEWHQNMRVVFRVLSLPREVPLVEPQGQEAQP